MQRRYVITDVFSANRFEGNQLAVILDADGLSPRQMQQITTEFGYSETTFVLPPRDPAHTAWVRIFTPSREIPFAGHPNIGTAYVLAAQAAAAGHALPSRLLFEEGAGPVPVELIKQGDTVIGAELTAPAPLSRHSVVDAAKVAECLSVDLADIRSDAHAPQVASVGLPFVVVELASREALRRCTPNPVAYKRTLPLDGAVSIYAYTRDVGANASGDCDLQARMFTGRMTEDAATGSATCAAIGLIAAVRGVSQLTLRIRQGVDMGRPSLLLAKVVTADGETRIRVGGHCAIAMQGTIELAGETNG